MSIHVWAIKIVDYYIFDGELFFLKGHILAFCQNDDLHSYDIIFVVVTASDDMWALSESGQLHRRSVHHIHCDQHQYTWVRATGSNDDGWELI